MIEYCDKRNPLIRDGTSQAQRLLKELEPSYVSVDERSFEDLLEFTKKYADYVKFCDPIKEDNSTESWAAFFENNIAVVIAVIANHDLERVREEYEGLRNSIEISQTDEDRLEGFENLLWFIFDMACQINRWYLQSVEGLGLNTDLAVIIASSLSDSAKKLVA